MTPAKSTSVPLCLLLAASTTSAAASIQIESGSYNGTCGALDSTSDLASHCNSTETCQYPVASPAPLRARRHCKTDFVAKWSCGNGETHEASVSAVEESDGASC